MVHVKMARFGGFLSDISIPWAFNTIDRDPPHQSIELKLLDICWSSNTPWPEHQQQSQGLLL